MKTPAELVACAKANPDKLVAGSQGAGTGPHLLIELLKLETGIKVVHVPYRGSRQITALIAGEIQMFFDSPTTILPHIESGKRAPDRGNHAQTPLGRAGHADDDGSGLSEN